MFPEAIPDAETQVETLCIERTFWEKVTILHALYHNGKLRDGMSRHYYDVVMLDGAGVTSAARAASDLLERVVHNKALMFAETAASCDTARFGTLRLMLSDEIKAPFERDYEAMSEMFMEAPPSAAEVLRILGALEQRINATAEDKSEPTTGGTGEA